MRIMQILPELKLAGAQIMMENLAIQLKKEGHDVFVVSLYSIQTAISKRLENSGIQVYYLEKKDGFDLRIIKKLRKCILDVKPEVVHTHSYVLKYAFAASIGYKCRRVHTVHNLADKETTRANLLLENVLVKTKYIRQVAISPLVKDSISQYYGLDKLSIPMIYNGIELRKCKVKQEYTFHNKEITVIHIGRFEPQKNHMLILQAAKILCAKYSDVRFNLWGEGRLQKEVQALIEKNGLKKSVRLMGLTDDVYRELQSADIFILPSSWEGMPITLIEAMGTGLPVVVTPVGGIPDMINDGVSGLFCRSEPADLANKLEFLILNKDLREKLGAAARKRAKDFSAEKMAAEYLNLYTEC